MFLFDDEEHHQHEATSIGGVRVPRPLDSIFGFTFLPFLSYNNSFDNLDANGKNKLLTRSPSYSTNSTSATMSVHFDSHYRPVVRDTAYPAKVENNDHENGGDRGDDWWRPYAAADDDDRVASATADGRSVGSRSRSVGSAGVRVQRRGNPRVRRSRSRRAIANESGGRSSARFDVDDPGGPTAVVEETRRERRMRRREEKRARRQAERDARAGQQKSPLRAFKRLGKRRQKRYGGGGNNHHNGNAGDFKNSNHQDKRIIGSEVEFGSELDLPSLMERAAASANNDDRARADHWASAEAADRAVEDLRNDLEILRGHEDRLRDLRSASDKLREETKKISLRMDFMADETAKLRNELMEHLARVASEMVRERLSMERCDRELKRLDSERHTVEEEADQVRERLRDAKKVSDAGAQKTNGTEPEEPEDVFYDSECPEEPTVRSKGGGTSVFHDTQTGSLSSAENDEDQPLDSSSPPPPTTIATPSSTAKTALLPPKSSSLPQTPSTPQSETTATMTTITPPLPPPVPLERKPSNSFIRVNDLQVPPHVRTEKVPARTPAVKVDSSLSVDDFFHLDSKGAPVVVEALVDAAMRYVSDGRDIGLMSWKPSDDTRRSLSKRILAPNDWVCPVGKEVLVWSGTFANDKRYGASLPAVKARAIIHASPSELVDLFLDNNRVKDYNKMSVGRTDVHVFREGVAAPAAPDHLARGTSKILRTLSKPPLVRRPIELLTFLNARVLSGNGDEPENPTRMKGYVIVTRAVTEDDQPRENAGGKKNEASRSEMLLGVNLLRCLDDDENRTELTTFTQVYSPIVPMMMAKRMGLMAAANFIKDIQGMYDN